MEKKPQKFLIISLISVSVLTVVGSNTLLAAEEPRSANNIESGENLQNNVISDNNPPIPSPPPTPYGIPRTTPYGSPVSPYDNPTPNPTPPPSPTPSNPPSY